MGRQAGLFDIEERFRELPANGDDLERINALVDFEAWRRGKADALLHHSDQGSQYASEQFQRLLADNGITCSMSRAGNVWGNSAMESFFSSLKTERTARKVYRTRDEALRRPGDWTIQIVKRSDTAKGFEVLPMRRVVERTFAWLGRCRRLAKDREKSVASAEARMFIAQIRILTRRLARYWCGA